MVKRAVEGMGYTVKHCMVYGKDQTKPVGFLDKFGFRTMPIQMRNGFGQNLYLTFLDSINSFLVEEGVGGLWEGLYTSKSRNEPSGLQIKASIENIPKAIEWHKKLCSEKFESKLNKALKQILEDLKNTT